MMTAVDAGVVDGGDLVAPGFSLFSLLSKQK